MHPEPILSAHIDRGIAVMDGREHDYNWVQFFPNKQQAYLCNLLFTWLIVKKHPLCKTIDEYINQIVHFSTTTSMSRELYRSSFRKIWSTLPKGVQKNIFLRITYTIKQFSCQQY